MGVTKQEFYEGAALHRLARTGKIESLRYDSPFFVVNGAILVHLKYTTKKKSPWGFSFAADERRLLLEKANGQSLTIGLICGSDGIAAITIEEFSEIAGDIGDSTHVACYRDHGKHYEVCGPVGALSRKVPPSHWLKTLDSVESE